MIRRDRRGRIRHVALADLDPFDPADHDDDENTDHLARLADPEVLARVLELEREQGGRRYGPRT